MGAIAEEAISKSKGLLSIEHKDEIKQLLNYLQKRAQNAAQTATGAMIDSFRPKTADARIGYKSKAPESTNGSDGPGKYSRSASRLATDCCSNSLALEYSIFDEIRKDLKLKDNLESEACITKLDDYIELLYEDYPDKYKGTVQIFHLAIVFENMIVLANHETLNLALARLLREEGRKSIELATLIVAIFASLSRYSQFHFIITKYKVGALCLDLVHLELDKEEMLARDLTEIKSLANDLHRSLSTSSSFNSLFSSLHHWF